MTSDYAETDYVTCYLVLNMLYLRFQNEYRVLSADDIAEAMEHVWRELGADERALLIDRGALTPEAMR